MEKMWNVYLIHHSHTDIGYTERQEKIMRYHYDFIRQAIEILDDIHSGKTTGCDALYGSVRTTGRSKISTRWQMRS